jgi:hypothetical protein
VIPHHRKIRRTGIVDGLTMKRFRYQALCARRATCMEDEQVTRPTLPPTGPLEKNADQQIARRPGRDHQPLGGTRQSDAVDEQKTQQLAATIVESLRVEAYETPVERYLTRRNTSRLLENLERATRWKSMLERSLVVPIGRRDGPLQSQSPLGATRVQPAKLILGWSESGPSVRARSWGSVS